HRCLVTVAGEVTVEGKDGMALCVEELRRKQMAREVLVLQADALDLRGAFEPPVAEARGEVRDLTRERGDRVGDLEGDVRVDRVGDERAGRLLFDGAHCAFLLGNLMTQGP